MGRHKEIWQQWQNSFDRYAKKQVTDFGVICPVVTCQLYVNYKKNEERLKQRRVGNPFSSKKENTE